MTDLRARLADEIHKLRLAQVLTSEELAERLLSLPGIAIVELPEGADVGQGWLQFKNVVAGPEGQILDEGGSPAIKHNATTARRHAASLLAAANARLEKKP